MLARSHRLGALLAALTIPAACTPAAAPQAVAPPPPAAAPSPPPSDPARLHVLMVNGGGVPQINYQSHLVHLKELRSLLLASGVRPEQISILSSDGDDPGPDVAAREAPPEADFWLLEGTRVGARLDTHVTLASSAIPGVRLVEASKANVGRWFDEEGRRLRAGDTLLLYVTDHGTRQNDDPFDNRITLWGKDQSVSVRELSALVGALDPGVRVVTLMSQCFSGGFGKLAWARLEGGEPAGNVCGYFSSTADRPAYGCYLENRGKDAVGHSFHFTHALAASGNLAAAHLDVLAADVSPDVPLRTSDLYLGEVLKRAAAAAGQPLPAFVDGELRAALRDAGRWEPEIRLLDRIAQAFGCFSPRSLAELADLAAKLPEIGDQLDTFERAWDTALHDATADNLDRFVRAHAEWNERLGDPTLTRLDPPGARAAAASLLGELGPFTRANVPVNDRLGKLKSRSDATEALSYRMEVRLGAVLRMKAVLTTIAGRAYLAKGASPKEAKALEALRSCEDLSLPKRAPAPEPLAAPAPYPPFDEDLRLAKTVLPGWMGVSFHDVGDDLKQKQKLTEGASQVMVVFPDSPAKSAGFEIGDIVLGPPGQPFTAKNQLRAFTMLSAIGEDAPLEVVRGKSHLTLSLVPKPFPMKWPELPGRTEIGAMAPALDVSAYRGPVKSSLQSGSAHLLYFWATWCGPCKAALPEVLAFEKEKKIPVVAITDEPAAQLDTFFKDWKSAFPKTVAIDELRKSFLAYGVSGTPTFVLVDEKGAVRGYQTGYLASAGLGIPGWTWAGRSR